MLISFLPHYCFWPFYKLPASSSRTSYHKSSFLFSATKEQQFGGRTFSAVTFLPALIVYVKVYGTEDSRRGKNSEDSTKISLSKPHGDRLSLDLDSPIIPNISLKTQRLRSESGKKICFEHTGSV